MIARGWRICRDSTGFYMYFDPRIEVPMVRGLTEEEKADILDRYGSVSALDEDEDTYVFGSQREMFDPVPPAQVP